MFGQRRLISTPTSFPVVRQDVNTDYRTKKSISDSVIDKTKADYQIISTTNDFITHKTDIKVMNASIVPGVGFVAGKTSMISHIYNQQTSSYIDTLTTEQTRLNQNNETFLNRVYSTVQNPTAKQTRNRNDWGSVKKLVIRDELMKLQIGGKTDLPLTDVQKIDLKKAIKGLDLSRMDDSQVDAIIDNILHTDERIHINALKAFKESGKIDSCFQLSKLEQLKEYLKDIDLSTITEKQYKHIKNNFIEKIEIHHRTSISNDPRQQSNIDNLDTLNTTQHNEKHTDPNTGKINYRRKLEEGPLDRKNELAEMNKKRVLNKKLTGLGITVAIGLGTGFAIGFIVSLAQNGINANSIKYAFVSGARQSASNVGMAAGGYFIGNTIGAIAGKTLTDCVKSLIGTNVAEDTLKKISEVCNMGAVGTLITVAFSVYEFVKLKCAGYTTKECLLRAGKTAALSFSILIISMIAVWAGFSGIAVSIVAGVVMTGYSIIKAQHNKQVSKDITFYSIELCKPTLHMI